MNSTPLKLVEIIGLHGDTDLSVPLRPRLNIIYGRNGTGKTTFLHVLANLVERDLERFCHIRFARIRVHTADEKVVELEQVLTPEAPPLVAVRLGSEPIGTVVLGKGTSDEIRNMLRDTLGGRPVYVPAFRSVLEAISQKRTQERYYTEAQRAAELKAIADREEREDHDERSRDEVRRRPMRPYSRGDHSQSIAYKTLLCRDWFGSFVPTVRFPSLYEVSDELTDEVEEAQLQVSFRDRAAFTEVFLDVLRSVLDSGARQPSAGVNELLSSIAGNLEALRESGADVPGVYSELESLVKNVREYKSKEESIAASILGVYDRALQARVAMQREAFRKIRTFEASVNRFLRGKRLKIESRESVRAHRRMRFGPWIVLRNHRETTLGVLSSGERHVLTLLFSATHMTTTDGILLVDEPELSLHVDWQRLILRELMSQAGERQIIACTHAPEVTAEHRESMVKLRPKPHDEVTAGLRTPDLFESQEKTE